MASASIKQVFQLSKISSQMQTSSPVFVASLQYSPFSGTTRDENFNNRIICRLNNGEHSVLHRSNTIAVCKASSGKNEVSSVNVEDDDGVSLGTMKLPLDTDLVRFESLLFQWANSLCQGAMIPLPVPLKVDKIPGGARLGFITIGDAGVTEVLAYIDCLVFPATDGSAPIFRAIRNGVRKNQPPPGEPRIMKSLLGALQKSVEIARL